MHVTSSLCVLAEYFASHGSATKVVGVPVTIDGACLASLLCCVSTRQQYLEEDNDDDLALARLGSSAG